MDQLIRFIIYTVAGIVAFVLLFLFLVPLLLIFAVLFLLQTLFGIKTVNFVKLRQKVPTGRARRAPEPAADHVPASEEVIDAVAVDLPDDPKPELNTRPDHQSSHQ